MAARPNRSSRRRIRLVTRASLKRLLILGVIVATALGIAHRVMIHMPGASWTGPLPPTTSEQQGLADRLRADVEHLCIDIGERNHWNPDAYLAAADWLADRLAAAGHAVVRTTEGIPLDDTSSARFDSTTLVAEIPGAGRTSEIVVVGAHYDSFFGTPGANDNASGVAVVLALADALAGNRPNRTIRLVLFPDEEPPFFQTDRMGSLRYARACRERGDNVVAMISIETIGWYDDAAGSQQYPAGLGMLYPSEGNFIGFVGNVASRRLLREVVSAFRRETPFPSEGGAMPSFLPGVSWSDHWAFWQAGYPGLMATDTAPFRYPHYHRRTDTPDRLDYERMARVVEGLERIVRGLGDGDT